MWCGSSGRHGADTLQALEFNLCHHPLGSKVRKADRLLEPSSGLPEQQQPAETIQDKGDPLCIPQQEGSSCKESSEWRVVHAHGRK